MKFRMSSSSASLSLEGAVQMAWQATFENIHFKMKWAEAVFWRVFRIFCVALFGFFLGVMPTTTSAQNFIIEQFGDFIGSPGEIVPGEVFALTTPAGVGNAQIGGVLQDPSTVHGDVGPGQFGGGTFAGTPVTRGGVTYDPLSSIMTRINSGNRGTYIDNNAPNPPTNSGYLNGMGFRVEFTDANGNPTPVPGEHFFMLDTDFSEWVVAFAVDINGNIVLPLSLPGSELATDTLSAATAAQWAADLGLASGPTGAGVSFQSNSVPGGSGPAVPNDDERTTVFDFQGIPVTEIYFFWGILTDQPPGPSNQNSAVSALILGNPEFDVLKDAVQGPFLPNGTLDVTYTVTVENTGTAVLTDLSLIDDLQSASNLGTAYNGLSTTAPAPSLTTTGTTSNFPTLDPTFDGSSSSSEAFVQDATTSIQPGESVTVEFTVNVNPSAADAPASLGNTATVSGTPEGFGFTASDDSNPSEDNVPGGPGSPTTIVPPEPTPALSIVKTADPKDAAVGETVTYTYAVENTGNVTINDVTVNDSHGGSGPFGPIVLDGFTNTSTVGSDDGLDAIVDELGPTDTATFTAEYVVTEEDAGATISNTATTSGTPAAGTLEQAEATETVDIAPAIEPDQSLDNLPGSTATIDLLANDPNAANLDPTTVSLVPPSDAVGVVTDADGNVKSFDVPGQGTWAVDASGVMTFTPLPEFLGDPDPIAYTVESNNGEIAEAAAITVTYLEAPVAEDETVESGAIAPVTFDPIGDLTSDEDGTVDPTSVSLVAPAGATDVILDADGDVIGFTVGGEGTWEVDPATGEITFTPEPGFVGDPTPVDYTVRDDDGLTSDPATLTIDYGEPPVPTDEQIVSGPIAPVTFDIIGDNLATDADGTVDPMSVSLTPLPGVSDIVTDADGDVLGFTVPGEGIWSVDPNTGAVTFTPEDGFVGDPTPVDYDVRDNDGNPSVAPGELSIDFGDPPVVEDDNFFSALIEPVTIDVLGNDNDDLDGGTLDPTSVVFTTTDLPAGGVISADGKTMTVPGEGEWTIDPDTGAMTFTPEDGFESSPTPVTYEVSDNDGNPSEPATVIVQYGNPPVAANNSATDLPLGEPYTLDPLANDFDGDDGLDPTSVQLTLTGAPADAVLSADGRTLTVPGEGAWTVDPVTGALTFTPEDGFIGDPTPISYTVDDLAGNTSNEAVVTLEFQEPPIAVDDLATGFPVDQPATINPLLNDSDPDSLVDPTLTVLLTVDNSPPGSTVSPDGKTVTVPGEGVWTVDPVSGDVTFTPEDGFRGNPTPVGYEITDVDGNVSNVATITLEFLEPPLALNDGASGFTEGQPASLNPLANDSGTDSPLDPTTVMLMLNPNTPAGAVLSGDGRTLTVPGEGVWTVDPVTGEVTFTPEPGFTDNPTPVDYTVLDEEGQETNVATITFEYESIPPVAVDDSVTDLIVGNAATLNPLANDSDEDGILEPTTVVFTGTGAPAGSQLSADGKTLTVPGEGVWTIDPVTGEVAFTPEDGFQGDPTPAAYTVADNGGNVSNEAFISLDYAAPTLLSGTVFVDSDNDSEFDSSESGLNTPVLVSLLDEDGNVVATTTTDANGFYSFSAFPLGTYTVTFTDPASGDGVAAPLGPIEFVLGDSEITEQNAPVIAAEQVGTLLLTKTTPLSTVVLGSPVPYVITVTNTTTDAVTADLVDVLPTGLVYTPASATIDGTATEPAVAGQTLTWSPVTIGASATVTLELVARVGPNAPVGDLTNTVRAVDSVTGGSLATPATATVRRDAEAVFDCSDVIGKVFDDRNFDGYQNALGGANRSFVTDQDIFVDGKYAPAPNQEGEPGLPNVRLVTPTGTIITTDEYGRYSVPCAELPGGSGTNFTLKLDTRSLPTGYRVTTENPRTMRVTAGILTEMNFGASLGRVIDIDLTTAAFGANNAPVARLDQGVTRILEQVASTPSILRISYFANGESRKTIKDRLDQLENTINARWRDIGDYRLIVERDVKYLQ